MIKVEEQLKKLLQHASAIDVNRIDLDDKEIIRNVLELLLKINKVQAEEIQRLRDEVARLKGEKDKPKIPPNKETEKDKTTPKEKFKNWNKNSKNDKINIDREVKVEVKKDDLPSDAVFKGYRDVIVQNLIVKTDNVRYRLERYYSAGENKTYEAELPVGLEGTQFGVDLKALVFDLYYNERVTENKIQKFLEQHGILISEGQISNILTKENAKEFGEEKEDILQAGIASSNFVHIDDTGARHNGINHYTQVLCNMLFTVFFTRRHKNAETVREILRLKPNEKLNMGLMSDDAKQFFYLAILQILCWVHEIRHYKKLDPHLDVHRVKVDKFLTRLSDFYEKLKKYKENPLVKKKKNLERDFDRLFSTETGYWALDKRIELTRAKKDRLLLVLEYPWLPLHNNTAEIALREIVIKRKISYGTRSESGKAAWENMMSILDTCRKQKVRFYEYARDVISGARSMKTLAARIRTGAASP